MTTTNDRTSTAEQVRAVSVGGMGRRPLLSVAALGLIGAILLAGGAYLIALGGSVYYAIAGAAVLACSILYFRRNMWGEWLYAFLLLGTLAWAFVDSDGTPWALVARLFAPSVLGLWLALPPVRRKLRSPAGFSHFPSATGIAAVALIAIIVLRFVQYTDAAYGPSASSLDGAPSLASANPADTDWPHYANGLDGRRFSDLTQVNVGNVSKLEVAWTHRSGELPPINLGEATPIKVGPTLYSCTPQSTIFALDAGTGRELWRSRANVPDLKKPVEFICRGVAFYAKPDATGACAARIIAAGPEGRLRAVDAQTGRPCEDFGVHGWVDLSEHMGPHRFDDYAPRAAPTVVNGVVILGGMVNDSRDADMVSGVIRAYDAVTGSLRWAWDMGVPDRIGAPPPGQTYTRSTPNSWTAFSADEKLGLVYVPTGNPQPDMWGVHRRPFDLKYGTSLVALNISDGRPRWSFQAVHRDLWDYDNPAQPVLTDLPGIGGSSTPIVVLPSKTGNLFVLDRRNGKPYLPIHHMVNLPRSRVPGENTSPVQPMSAASVFPAPMEEQRMWGATPIDQMLCRIAFRKLRYEGPFTPPGLDRSLEYPQVQGMLNWGSTAIDSDRKIAVLAVMDIPTIMQLLPRETVPNPDVGFEGGKAVFPMRHTPFVLTGSPFLSPMFMPCAQPPFGRLVAIDLTTGKQLWTKTLGTLRDVGPFGSRLPVPLIMGAPHAGGAIVTRGGIIFIAATTDRTFRALDIRTGKLLWEHVLPAGGNAVPMTYMANRRQYIVLTAGGHSFINSRTGDYTIAFTLLNGG